MDSGEVRHQDQSESFVSKRHHMSEEKTDSGSVTTSYIRSKLAMVTYAWRGKCLVHPSFTARLYF